MTWLPVRNLEFKDSIFVFRRRFINLNEAVVASSAYAAAEQKKSFDQKESSGRKAFSLSIQTFDSGSD